MLQNSPATDFDRHGFVVFDSDNRVRVWAQAAGNAAQRILADPQEQKRWLRHGNTWFVGVDCLPNGADGAVAGVALSGPWEDLISAPEEWHRAQVSAIYSGYPHQDATDTDAAYRYRVHRNAAHVDGLLPEGPAKRRYLREPHAFVLGVPLTTTPASPLMVWPGSHRMMGAAFQAACAGKDPGAVDLTDPYQSARRAVFDQITPLPLRADPGQSILLHRHLLHGIAPWGNMPDGPPRIVAYFRPQLTTLADWL